MKCDENDHNLPINTIEEKSTYSLIVGTLLFIQSVKQHSATAFYEKFSFRFDIIFPRVEGDNASRYLQRKNVTISTKLL